MPGGRAFRGPPPVDGKSRVSPRREAIERRPVMVAFIALVGSTALASRLDPEAQT